ncbi:MAG TPA: MFS transporter, partial [Bryobacteraceae bacterium]|nr:MFS transporter [Bryobacteraceae bacterium]
SRIRYWVVVFAVTLAIITYIDRACLGFVAPSVMADLRLTKQQMGIAFSAFSIAYALFEIPGGFLGDWIGPRKVLMRIVIWWSCFTAFTGMAWNFVSLTVGQALFGAGEAGCFPNLTKAFTAWLPGEERVRAQGILWLSARWGGAFTPPLVFLVLQSLPSWRQAFFLFGGIGVVWAVFFYRWYRNDPRENPHVNEGELALLEKNRHMISGHGPIPWRRFARSRQVWLLCLQYACLSYGWYFYMFWLPTYLRESRGLDLTRSAFLGILPLFLGGIGSFFSGFISASVSKWTGSTAKTRRLMAYLAFSGAGGLLLVSTVIRDPLLAMIAMGFASFCNDLAMPGSWGACMDVGGKAAGTLSGSMNMTGNIGGALQPAATGFIVALTQNWNVAFYVSAGIYFLGIFCWMFLDPVTPLETESAA